MNTLEVHLITREWVISLYVMMGKDEYSTTGSWIYIILLVDLFLDKKNDINSMLDFLGHCTLSIKGCSFLLNNSKIYMSRVTKKYEWVSELKLKAKALQHLKVNLVLKINATTHTGHINFPRRGSFIWRTVSFFLI